MTTKLGWILCAAVVGAAIATAIQPDRADAAMIPGVCKFRFSRDTDLPASVRQMMKSNQDEASFACVDQGKALTYESVTDIRVGSHNVCAFSKFTRLDYLGGKVDPGYPGEDYMLLGQPNCPRQDDERYIRVEGLSDGLLAFFVQFAEEIRRSESDFDAAFLPEKPLTDREQAAYLRMRAALLDRRSPIQFELKGMGPGMTFNSNALNYGMTFQERPFCGNSWTLSVDLIAGEWKVIDFDGFMQVGEFIPAPICPR